MSEAIADGGFPSKPGLEKSAQPAEWGLNQSGSITKLLNDNQHGPSSQGGSGTEDNGKTGTVDSNQSRPTSKGY